MSSTFSAEIHLLPAELGGRVGPLVSGEWRTVLGIDKEHWSARLGDDVTQEQAFAHANDLLKNAVGGISDIINIPGLANVDFEDVKTVMSEPGKAMMGTAVGGRPDGATKAAESAVACPLLEGIALSSARKAVSQPPLSVVQQPMQALRTGTDNLPILNQVAQQPVNISQGHAPSVQGYESLNTPSVWRSARSQAAAKVDALASNGMDDIDIPAFLRKQAD